MFLKYFAKIKIIVVSDHLRDLLKGMGRRLEKRLRFRDSEFGQMLRKGLTQIFGKKCTTVVGCMR